MKKYLWLFLLLTGLNLLSVAQIPEGMDTLSVYKRTFLVLKDTTIYIERDTILMLPDTVVARIRQQNTSSRDFYLRMKEKFSGKKATRRLYDALVDVPDKNKNVIPPTPPHVLKYQEAAGKRISNVRIKKLDVFGTSISDTTRYTDLWLIKAANATHVNTHGRVIRNNLFFKEGDRVDPDALRDSERFLRSLDYIKDARIIVLDEGDSDQVEILVITKDVFSLSLDIDYRDLDRFDVELTDNNILGFGHELTNEFLYDADNDPKVGYAGRYRINSLGRSFVRLDVEYVTSEPVRRLGFRVERQFITPDIRWAGGFAAFGDRRERVYTYPDTSIFFFTGQDFQEAWAGHSLVMTREGDARFNLIFSGLFGNYDFYERPEVSADTNQAFLDRKLYMTSFGITKRSYEKGRLIAAFGRTEDIPLGYTAQLLIGREVNELYARNYWGARLEAGHFNRMGYFRPIFEIGGFLNNSNWEQAQVHMEVNYFSNLYRMNQYRFRQFFRFGYTRGINRFPNEFVRFDDEDGVRGLDDEFIRGTKKINFSWETVAFTPYYFLGFRFALYAFADLAVVNHEKSKLFDNTIYQGYGIGVRIRNDNLAINAIQIQLVYYPNPAPGDPYFGADISGRPLFRIPDLRIEKPLPIDYR